jgi:transposase
MAKKGVAKKRVRVTKGIISAVMRLRRDKYTYEDIGKRYGVCTSTVTNWLDRCGVPRDKKKRNKGPKREHTTEAHIEQHAGCREGFTCPVYKDQKFCPVIRVSR